MAVWSRLFLSAGQKLFKSNGASANVMSKNGIVRCMSDNHSMIITASRWQWHQFKNWMHFYFFVGAIPVAIVVFCANVFIGPATLEPIPEGYVPKRWEYFRSPITRFMSRYLCPIKQQEYEKFLAKAAILQEQKNLRILHKQVRSLIRRHQDYPAFAYRRSLTSTSIRKYREHLDQLNG
ncbi:NADH dehydrogenase [ubiquinone] 1 beta subcomplex subunit 5, mitochondrial [Hylaeus volcanicus]|uniref:NADH dehydrogenase [ubiquinone] 1 beta subcomplex subunit 5, mitochondrial n=1 Tax=Hylaeus volcanicus TaxID=313075 RepID=UPI0023B876D8|nr:NADH dehydrogenase [ubiquinone] 1 beta subcomplex subunit 5, mitochondrial [Hylaeus volcanicus]